MMSEKIERIQKSFINYFGLLEYKQSEEVLISSGIDPSVVFIGSAISVFKPLFINRKIDTKGNFIVQKAIRTQALKNIYNAQYSEWSSYFDALGVLTRYDRLDILIEHSIEFLKNVMNLDNSKLLIRINNNDTDLDNATSKFNIKKEYNAFEDKYYQHRYGLDDIHISGRNINIAIESNDKFLDIGNVIVIESPMEKFGVEFAVGVNAILMRRDNIKTSIEASSISDIIKIDSPEKFKFADCIAVVSHLAYEDIERLNKKRSPIYLYRKYLTALSYWQKRLGISNEGLRNIIKDYIILEYGTYSEEIVEKNTRRLYLEKR